MNDSNERAENIRQQLISILDYYLNERERTILLLRVGLIDGVVHTLQEIGEMFSISRERVRQIE
ncbi:MAG: sigma factor-like helix-turn-helix DNA-binding protein, partial [bacterium]|nr:sigma factor-like helix-turn-helix DNA-binding protein [bacterium]